jgi:hypothetical protein
MIRGGFSFAILCSSVMIAESLTIRVFGYTSEPTRLFARLLFTAYFVFFIVANYVFLSNFKRKIISEIKAKSSYVGFKAILLAQIAICALIGVITLQLFLSGSYYLVILTSVVYLSHLVAIVSCVHKLSILWLVHT